MPKDYSNNVPNDVMLDIFSYLTLEEKMKISSVSKRFNHLSNQPRLWNLPSGSTSEDAKRHKHKILNYFGLFSTEEMKNTTLDERKITLSQPKKIFLSVAVSTNGEDLTDENLESALQKSDYLGIAFTENGAKEFLNVPIAGRQTVICEFSAPKKLQSTLSTCLHYNTEYEMRSPWIVFNNPPRNIPKFPLEAFINTQYFESYWIRDGEGKLTSIDYKLHIVREVEEENKSTTCGIM